MRMRNIGLVILALIAAGGTAQLARTWLEAERNAMSAKEAVAAPSMPEVEVLVAAQELPAGTLLKDANLRWQPWPKSGLTNAYMLKGRSDKKSVEGAVVRQGLSEGAPITEGGVVRPGDRGFLAAMLTPGKRAISVPVTESSGIAGLIFPGDRVDVILSHTYERQDNASKLPRRASETVLHDIRVLALDQRTDDQDGQPTLAKTATLEVTSKQAETISVARELGQLSLALRSIRADGEDGAEPDKHHHTYTLDSQASALLHREDADDGPRVVIVRGGERQELSFGDTASKGSDTTAQKTGDEE